MPMYRRSSVSRGGSIGAGENRVKVKYWLLALLLMGQPALAAPRVLLIRGLMDYIPGVSPMTSLKTRLEGEGYDVTMITHLADGSYIDQSWDAVIGHSQGAIDALRDAREFARHSPHLTIITLDPPRTSVEFHCVAGVRYLDLHTAEFGLGGGWLTCPQASNVDMGGLHITLPMRSDAQERILAFLHEDDAPVEVADAKPVPVSDLLPKRDTGASAKSSPRPDPLAPLLAYANDDARAGAAAAKPAAVSAAPLKPVARLPKPALAAKPADDTSFDTRFAAGNSSFDARFTALWVDAANVLGGPVIPWTQESYAGVLTASD
jgi:hypothetical protein